MYQITDMEKKGSRLPPPNGGWGWMIVFGAALINLVNQSLFSNFGLIFGKHLKELNGSATGITLVMAVNVVVANCSGLLVGPLLKKFSISTVNYIGISFTGSGMIVCSYSTALWHYCIGYGFMTGLGLGLLLSGTFLAVNDQFTTKKGVAVGMTMAGTGIGQTTMPPLIGLMLKYYKFDWTVFILGFINFIGFIGAFLYKPRFCCKRWVSKNRQHGDSNKADSKYNEIDISQIKEDGENEESSLLSTQLKPVIIGITQDFHDEGQPLGIKDKKKLNWMKKISTALGLPLLRDLTYVHIVLGVGFGYAGSIAYSAFLPMFLQEEAKLSLMYTTYCMTAASLADVIGRLTTPEIGRRLKFRSRSYLMIGCFLLAVARSCLAALKEFKAILVVSFFSGYFKSITVTNQNLVVSEHINREHLPSAIGLKMVVNAILVMTFGHSLGYLKDCFTYAFCIHISNIVLCLVVLCYLAEKLVKWLLNRKHEVMGIEEPETVEA